jgi:hypothetical protein
MFIACIGYVSYGVLPWIPPVIADIGDNRPPPPQLDRYNITRILRGFILLRYTNSSIKP